MIHKRILDSAETQPKASMEELAAGVAGASPELVERVLDEYGDPGLEEPPEPGPAQEATMTDNAASPTDVELTDKQREVLRAIAARPNATQEELAEHLGVSRATVNKRVNGIEGFEWSARSAFVDALFVDEPVDAGPPDPAVDDRPAAAASDGGQLLAAGDDRVIEQLRERLARLEQQVGDRPDEARSVLGDAALTAKVVRAVVADDAITEEEELRVLEALL